MILGSLVGLEQEDAKSVEFHGPPHKVQGSTEHDVSTRTSRAARPASHAFCAAWLANVSNTNSISLRETSGNQGQTLTTAGMSECPARPSRSRGDRLSCLAHARSIYMDARHTCGRSTRGSAKPQETWKKPR